MDENGTGKEGDRGSFEFTKSCDDEVNNNNHNSNHRNKDNNDNKDKNEQQNPASKYPAGSSLNPYRLAIVGGGPAGCAIIVRAIRLAMIHELCSQSDTAAGVCLIEAGELQKFGGGRLQEYRINSNTFGRKFVTNVIEDKPTLEPPEIVEETQLEKLRASTLGQLIATNGNESAPLPQVGAFLHEVGDVVYEVLRSFNPSSKCLLETKVIKVQRHLNQWKLTLKSSMLTEAVEIYAKSVCFATGGKQNIPSAHFTASQLSKVVCSDEFCTKNGIYEARKKCLTKTQPKVVIVGGSHSAFSAAWVCSQILSKEEEDPTISMGGGVFEHLPAVKFGPAGICIMHRSYIRVFFCSKKDADNDGYKDVGVISKSTGQIHPFGGLRGDSKVLWRQIKNNEEPRIRLVPCKSPPKNADPTVPAPVSSIATKLYDDATIIVWACGYSSNIPCIVDQCGKAIELVEVRGQLEVDDTAHLKSKQVDISGITRDPPGPGAAQKVPGLLGCGLGFGLKALLDNGEPDGSSGRADGVAVYLKRGATLVLAEVLGNKVFGEGNESWEVRVASILKNARSPTTAPQMSVSIDASDSTQTVAGKLGASSSVSAPSSPLPNFMSPKKPVKDTATNNEYKFRATPVPTSNKVKIISSFSAATTPTSSSSSSSSPNMSPIRPKTSAVSSRSDNYANNKSNVAGDSNGNNNINKRVTAVSTTPINRGVGSSGAGNRNRIRSIHSDTLLANINYSGDNNAVATNTLVKLPSLKVNSAVVSMGSKGSGILTSVSPTPGSPCAMLSSSSGKFSNSSGNSGQRRKSAPLIQVFQQRQQVLEKKFPLKNNIVMVLPAKAASTDAIPQATASRKGISGNSVNSGSRLKSISFSGSGSMNVDMVSKRAVTEGAKIQSQFEFVDGLATS